MKTLLLLIAVGVIGFLGYQIVQKQPEQLVGGDFGFFAPTNATSTVGIYTWTRIATTTPNMGFAQICDNADIGVVANNPVYIGFGATSTKPYGFRLGSGECYKMSQADNNMFYGFIYALASGSTTTILSTYK